LIILVRTKGIKINKGSNKTIEVTNPIQNERQVTQENGFLSFLLGNLAIKKWKNSCNAKAKPEIHRAFNNIIIIYIENSHLKPNAVLPFPLQQLDIVAA
jgi:hypothetical protein